MARRSSTVTPAEYHYNPIGSVHGGVYATICDSACGCAVHTMLPAWGVLHLPRPGHPVHPADHLRTGRLLCEGTVDYIGNRTALARARLVNADGKLFAQATSNCLIFRPGDWTEARGAHGGARPSRRVGPQERGAAAPAAAAGHAAGIFRL